MRILKLISKASDRRYEKKLKKRSTLKPKYKLIVYPHLNSKEKRDVIYTDSLNKLPTLNLIKKMKVTLLILKNKRGTYSKMKTLNKKR
jgi:hypothetical protein